MFGSRSFDSPLHEGEQRNDDHDRTCDEQDFIPTALMCKQVGNSGV